MEPFSAISRALPPSTRVFGFRGSEGLSSLYRFELYLFIEEATFDMAGAVGSDVALTFNGLGGRPPMPVHGMLASVETVGDLLHGALYRAVLVPRLHRLTLTHHSKVFVNQSMLEILQQVLEDEGFEKDKDFAFRLSARYAPFEHVCQYRESSFAFLSRRMEREGVYYFFEQGEGRERLVITDDRSFHTALSPESVRWVQVAGAGARGGSGLRQFVCKHTSIPGRVLVRDYDYLKPKLDVSGEAAASGWDQEIFLHAENAVTPEDSQRLARLRAEELLARQVVYRGTGRGAVFLRSGYTFHVEDHPRFDGDYLAIEVEHQGKQGGLPEGADELMGIEAAHQSHADDSIYRFDVVAIPAKVQFRPERRTPVPRIYGLEKAVVDGDADHHYAQIDDHGRYFVKIMFDESALKNGKASTRIRMMQPHAGNPESFHFPLRKGTEVLLAFDGGDPDRPLIAGVVPNLHKPTLVTGQNYTKNILATGGRNMFLIEDREEYQFMRLSSPIHNSFIHLGAPNDSHNKISFTGGNSLSVTGYDSESNVGGSRVSVTGDLFYKMYLAPNYVSSNPQIGQTLIDNVEHDPDDTGGNRIIAEARDVSAAKFANNNPSIVKEGDLTLSPLTMYFDPDTRTSYRPGSSLNYTLGDSVSKLQHDSVSLVLGNSSTHTHGHTRTTVGNPPGGYVPHPVPGPGDPRQRTTVWGDTESTTDGNTVSHVTGHTSSLVEGGSLNITYPVSISIFLSQFSFGVISSAQTLYTVKNYGTEITSVIQKIIH
jgi:type VI secretion system secreted protein VgrG